MKIRNKPFVESCAVAGLIAIASISVEAGSYTHQDGIQVPESRHPYQDGVINHLNIRVSQYKYQDGVQAPEANNISRFSTVAGKPVHQDGINPIVVDSDKEITN